MTTLQISAHTEPGLVRSNNEDYLKVSSDLSVTSSYTDGKVFELGKYGALMVVADGMGGMNAGEVASRLATEAMMEHFAPDNITPQILKNDKSRVRFMEEGFLKADVCLKKACRKDETIRGMGTTMVLAWLINGKAYVSWCGDSRCYLFRPSTGLRRLSKDHSYVQSLVDKGTLTEDEAFDFPQNNIITRSLGDGDAQADCESLQKPCRLSEGDILILCSDGLSGLVRDKQIGQTVDTHQNDLPSVVRELTKAALDNGGHDNITICACKVLQTDSLKTFLRKNSWTMAALTTALIAAMLASAFFMNRNTTDKPQMLEPTKSLKTDTLHSGMQEAEYTDDTPTHDIGETLEPKNVTDDNDRQDSTIVLLIKDNDSLTTPMRDKVNMNQNNSNNPNNSTIFDKPN